MKPNADRHKRIRITSSPHGTRSKTVVGAASVVTKDIPDVVLAAGNPCRVIREIREESHDGPSL